MKIRAACATIVLAAVAAACGGPPQPGDPGYAYNLDGDYNVEFDGDDGTTYSGTLSLTTEAGGVVAGTLALVSPMGIDGTAEGMIVGAQFDMTLRFFIPDAQCGGVATSTATIAQGGDSAEGTAEIAPDPECGGPSSAVFTLTR